MSKRYYVLAITLNNAGSIQKLDDVGGVDIIHEITGQLIDSDVILQPPWRRKV